MKYMSFNSSCSYAGVANMLEVYGINIEDYELALKMELPYMIEKSDQGYMSGPMLQANKWFNIALKQYGYELIE